MKVKIYFSDNPFQYSIFVSILNNKNEKKGLYIDCFYGVYNELLPTK